MADGSPAPSRFDGQCAGTGPTFEWTGRDPQPGAYGSTQEPAIHGLVEPPGVDEVLPLRFIWRWNCPDCFCFGFSWLAGVCSASRLGYRIVEVVDEGRDLLAEILDR